ncbi:MAG TPA: SgcJ/EcaC family oxidoreductase [Gaiellaceae bacterium]|jgi:uncharacterized protein (TIGR02246 family)|nr:SgcJ/EcaC family oxidoreductase [Gaiellaceae bacterium]
MTDEAAVQQLYEELIAGWNDRRGEAFAAPFAPDGVVVGFDGSEHQGREAIAAEMERIFADHETAPYVKQVRSVRLLSPDAAVLRAVVGMIPPGGSDIEPARNAHQTLVAAKQDGEWRIVLFQNTPAQFHGRPDLAERLTQDLRKVLQASA